MTTKPKESQKKTPAIASDKNQLKIKHDNEKSHDRAIADVALCSTTINAITSRNFNKHFIGETDLTETVASMFDKVKAVNNGNTKQLEATLTAQATSLDTIFNELARRSCMNMGEHLSATETYMRLALKAQAQCARTIEVLAAMKNPPVVFAKQANITNGNQQINNGSLPTNNPAHAGKNINQPNELLEAQYHGEWMDNGKKAKTSATDTAMATLETLDRGENASG
jgi:hypothetical protein